MKLKNRIIILFLLVIVISLFIQILFYIEKFEASDITIFNKPTDSTLDITYNIGDILNIQALTGLWPLNTHDNFEYYKKCTNYYKNTIINNYDNLRIDKSEPIPNIDKIQKSVDKYILDNTELSLNRILSKVNNNDTLCIHLRAGDKPVEPEFIDIINNISKDYLNVIILTGIHSGRSDFSNINDYKQHIADNINKINNKNIEVNIDGPDNHLCIFRKCKNLLVHQGGFSILGTILFTGNNLYITKNFNIDGLLNAENQIWKNYIENTTHKYKMI